MQAPNAPAALFLSAKAGTGLSAEVKAGVVEWARRLSDASGRDAQALTCVERMVQGRRDQVVCEETRRGNYGMVMIGRNPSQLWRERLLYALRHKVIGLVSPNPRLHDVAVLLDFSATSLLVLQFLRHAYGDRPDFRLHFLHAANSNDTRARDRWAELKKAVEFKTDAPLDLIPSHGNANAAIVDAIAKGPYGTIVMGKRGLSGIKRLLLGSVSRAVLHTLDDQSLILVD
jgi:2,4-dienoyl-CoA reductase (NADPH2)